LKKKKTLQITHSCHHRRFFCTRAAAVKGGRRNTAFSTVEHSSSFFFERGETSSPQVLFYVSDGVDLSQIQKTRKSKVKILIQKIDEKSKGLI
jgi:hypothetical protein